jgi:hypothetical protein
MTPTPTLTLTQSLSDPNLPLKSPRDLPNMECSSENVTLYNIVEKLEITIEVSSEGVKKDNYPR